jgi:hypothetical protein
MNPTLPVRSIILAQTDTASSWCGGPQSSLDPAGPQAAQISDLWWQYFWVSVAVYTSVILLLILAAIVRRSRVAVGEPLVVPFSIASAGNFSSDVFSSCRHAISGSDFSSQRRRIDSRLLIPLTL